jgi:formate hydrogenlyase transcriptional activator
MVTSTVMAIDEGLQQRALSNDDVIQFARLGCQGSCNEPRGLAQRFQGIIGSSPQLGAVLQQVRMVAPVDTTVLIQGETGTGKELIAQAIHDFSPRRGRPFLKMNCAAIPASLIESELFGHERGAFTGALTRRAGRFEAAHGGTLFLDEIGDMPLELQAKLLRVLQEHELERLGGTTTIRVDVRVVAATNQDLKALSDGKQFRTDLFYRLNVFPIVLPPLRDRCADIELLAEHFVAVFSERMKKRVDTIPDEARRELLRHDWPGNVRELQNIIERSVLQSEGDVLTLCLPHRVQPQRPNPVTMADAERDHILRALGDTKWVVGGRRGAAERLGMKRTTLMSRMQKLGIRKACIPGFA